MSVKLTDNFLLELNSISREPDACKRVDVIGGYIAKKILKRSPCEDCKNLILSEKQSFLNEYQYLSKLSREGLLLPSFKLFC